MKTFSKWVTHDEKPTLDILNCSPLFVYATLNLFPHLTVIYKKRGLYTTTRTTSSMVRPRNFKVMSKAKLAPKGYGHGAIHYSFLNPKKIFMSKTYA